MPDSPHTLDARIAANYDRVLYDPKIGERLDPAKLRAIAARRGPVEESPGVLDLGCGRGGQLARCAPFTTGPLVGLDLSADSCAAAAARLADHGDRADLRCADFLDVAPGSLGRFGVVYHVGTHYLLPEPVQRHALDLVGTSVAPGGVAVISYYAGTISFLRAALHRAVRAAVDPALDPPAAVAAARARFAAIRAELADRWHPLLVEAIDDSCGKNDTVFFHEVLNHAFDALHTSAIEAALARHGLAFCGYVSPFPSDDAPTSAARAFAADLFDYRYGGYRHAVFSAAASR